MININNIFKSRKKKDKICVFMLTYNRTKYIERSIESLYKRAGCEFDLYVLDDCSDEETQKKIQDLKEKYNFRVFNNKERMGIFKSFYWNLNNIPITYDYYVKLDSDIEILSDSFFPEILENFKFPEALGGATPRTEGIRNIDRYDSAMEFYGGHAIKKEAPIVYGCCLILPNKTFTSFGRLKKEEIERITEKWGVDSMLYDHALKIGKFLIIEDLSVYHIDNTYGQRRVNDEYFTNRKRWNIIDNNEVWYMKASKFIYPEFLNRNVYDKIKKISINFEEFLINCNVYLKDNKLVELKVEEQKEKIMTTPKPPIFAKKMYKISSPLNFRPDPNIQRGTFKYFLTIPIWAKNNPRVVIESEEVKVEEIKPEIKKEVKIEQKEEIKTEEKKEVKVLEPVVTEELKESEQKVFKCANCDFIAKSNTGLKVHQRFKHK